VEWVSVNMGNVGYGGGLRINTRCETTVKGLYAAGDATCAPASGVEGYCAFAIPFATTSGARSGLAAARYIKDTGDRSLDADEIASSKEALFRPLEAPDGVEPDIVVLNVQELLFPSDLYLIRHDTRLQNALDRICRIRDDVVPFLKAYDPHYLRMAIEASHMVTCAELFLRAALARKESRGSHLREDFPEVDNINWLKWIVLKQDNHQVICTTEDIPIENYPLEPKKEKIMHPVAKVMDM
ncbi:MAG: FAD-binding protein, partial [Deltaproteobacteria bacterium]|nr:FAD-binding protein [Deltaproteobacteria bacterium]